MHANFSPKPEARKHLGDPGTHETTKVKSTLKNQAVIV